MLKAILLLLLTLFLNALATPSFVAAASPGRTTNDRDHDLIKALILDRQFDLASQIAESAANLSPPDSDDAARWAMRRCEIETARRRSLDDFSDLEVQLAEKPITDFLRANPDHRRQRFLELAVSRVLVAAAEQDLLAFVINKADVEKADRGLKRLTRLSSALQELQQQIRRERIELDTQASETRTSDPRRHVMIDDLDRLSQQTLVELLRVKLLANERFDPGSKDRIAAATAAVDAADKALMRLPDRCDARDEVEQLRVVALEQMNNFQLARSEWEGLAQSSSANRDPRFLAIGIRIELRDGNLAEVKNRLAAFDSARSDRSNASIDIDLVRLEYLIAAGNSNDDRISQWMEEVGVRHGAYGRRRAEAILLSSLHSSDLSGVSLNPSIVATQGRQLLRQDQPLRAAQMLARSAAATPSSEQAISVAIESAAAFAAAGRPADAATILMQTAVDHPDAKAAAAAHLQSTILAANSGQSVSETKARLHETIALWPRSSEAQQSADWLINLYKAENHILEAAETATRMLTDDSNIADIDAAFELWKQLLRKPEDNAVQKEWETSMVRLNESLTPLLSRHEILDRYTHLAVFYFDRPDLLAIDSEKFESSADEYQTQFYRFRRSPTTAPPLPSPPHALQDTVTERLMNDARQNSSLRPTIGQTLLRWPQLADGSLSHAQRQLWAGQIDAANETIEKRLANSNDRAETLNQAARMLGQSNSPSAVRESVKRWDQLASGLKIGSEAWHQAKRQALEGLNQLGDDEECRKRAIYILLTSPPKQPDLQRQYRKFVENPS
ncbi:hypothetical protein Q31b_43950 [Novipirellula aureliae]|uniref:Anaphase-promoting complex, cyclosome, subunit 3 n=1 Tax=Novipirellula aureliae TaxID=2527966 RepID=A0A5C6DP05_9BACT|nr:hypothetical protein [Novipirellula aureliae]TWU37607.1 hypothetical protein Q31b_43950 [Novipirellula aureliae]